MSEFDDHSSADDSHENEEPWLISYADMMTLLFGFFVIMYSLEAAKNNNDTDAMDTMREKVSQYFGGAYITPLKEVADNFKEDLKGSKLAKDIEIKVTPEGFKVMLSSSTFFPSGSAELFSSAHQTISELIVKIRSYEQTNKTPSHHVRIEGHTDDVPLRKGGRYPSNWELSGARASTIIRLFEKHDFPPNQLMAIGYGSTRPSVPNRDANGNAIKVNQQRNRRVVITIHAPPNAI